MPNYCIEQEKYYTEENPVLYIRDAFQEYNAHVRECSFSDLDEY